MKKIGIQKSFSFDPELKINNSINFKNELNKAIEKIRIPETKKSIDDLMEDIIEKANGWGQKIPIKKQTSDGRTITYWVTPEDLNQGKMKGQQNLFGDDELDQGVEPEDSYNMASDKQIQDLKITPLVNKLKESDPVLANRINNKYTEYKWGRETRDLDIDLDYETLEFYRKVKANPDYKDEYYKDYLAETEKTAKKLNNRKMAMARLKVNSKVNYNGQPAVITGLSQRGFPIVKFADGMQKKVMVDEIADIDSLIKKYGQIA